MYLIRLELDEPLPEIVPGQFVMLRLPKRSQPLLGRPLAIYKCDPERGIIELVYVVVGTMTDRLSRVRTGELLEIWGPLGNGFTESGPETNVLCVAGGIGFTPLLMFSERMKSLGNNVRLLYGARSSNLIACMDDFRDAGIEVSIATEDGTEGTRALVTDLIPESLGEKTKIFSCGPHPMLKSVFETARKYNTPCDVSLESPMACGLGICYSCVIEYLNENEEWDYRRTCTEGPVFDAYRLKWN